MSSSKLPIGPFDPARLIGAVFRVSPTEVQIGLNWSHSPRVRSEAGSAMHHGDVGCFVVVEIEHYALLAQITDLRLPERERPSIDPISDPENLQGRPIASARLVSAIDLERNQVLGGIPRFPTIGSRVFSAHPEIVRFAIQSTEGLGTLRIALGTLPDADDMAIGVEASRLFGRHCSVLGTTGGGKSWTVAHLLEQIGKAHGRAILIDATGEYKSLQDNVDHFWMGSAAPGTTTTGAQLSFHYYALSESDWMVLLQPSALMQAPKLREALRSLKLVHIVPTLATNGLLRKANSPRGPIDQAFRLNEAAIKANGAQFDIQRLADQIAEECVWPTARNNNLAWGDTDQQALGYCASLISRISGAISSDALSVFFDHTGTQPVDTALNQFLAGPRRVLVLSLRDVSFEMHTREILVNAIGRYLLDLARRGSFRNNPTVVFLDEAHQFLERAIGEDFNRIRLESFGLIAKEGRKFGLTSVIATQRPRDIPEDVLSQIGAFLIHKLVNEKDREAVQRACGELDGSTSKFLASLSPGEAIGLGIGAPMPLRIRITAPANQPESRGPDYDKYWGVRAPPPPPAVTELPVPQPPPPPPPQRG